MPQWNNRAAVLYHGTDTSKLSSYAQVTTHSTLTSYKVNLAFCSPFTDFGQGFYTTTWEHQARQWANERAIKSQSQGNSGAAAVLLSFSVDRDVLGALDSLCFVRADRDYWDLVADCRLGFPPHQRGRGRGTTAYDVVYGPVSLWGQLLTIYESDQVSFHTPRAVAMLPPPYVCDIATSSQGLFT